MSWIFCLALWAAAYVWLRRLTRLRIDDAMLGAGLMVCAEAIAACSVLGAFGALAPGPVRIATAAFAVGHAVWAALLPKPRVHRSPPKTTVLLWPALAAFGVVAGLRLALASALPVDSWDGLSYHVPILWRWIEQGNFDLSGWSGPQRWFPWNGEMLPAWLCLLDGGSVDAVKTVQVLGLPLMAAAGSSLTRRLAGPAWGTAGALALASVPIAIIHAGLPYVDLLYAAWWAAAAACAVAWDRHGRPVHLLLWSLGFGLALGAKATLYFMAPLALPLLLAAACDLARRRGLLRAVPAMAAIILVTGGACYARNWIEQGSPIFPYAFKLAGRTIFAGPLEPGQLLVTVEQWFVPNRAGWLWYPLRETMKGVVGYSGENGFGPLFMAGWFLFPWIVWQAWRRRDRAALGFLSLLPATALFFVTLHPTREQRYVIFAAAVPIVGLAVLMRGLRGRARIAALGLWSAGIIFGLAGAAAYAANDPAQRGALAQIFRGGSVDAHEYYRIQYGALGQAWAALDSRLLSGETTATNYGELMLPWVGTPARGKILVVGHRPNDLPGALWASDAASWTALLDHNQVRYFALFSPAWYEGVGREERAFIAAAPERFKSLGAWSSGGIGSVELFELQAQVQAPR